MYLPVPSQRTCARAWAAAAAALLEARGEAFNVIIDVAEPNQSDSADEEIVARVDSLLREHDAYPISTVANTIFPQALLEAHGSPAFYDEYLRNYDSLSASSRRWGRYFERMIRHRKAEEGWYNPLELLIAKMRQHSRYTSAFELAIYDPLRDGRSVRGGQCLSFISFKIRKPSILLMTAMYRNHSYITRCLGNLLGLARLQAFVASQAGLKQGSLTCISTHATIDAEHWGMAKAKTLIHEAAELL